MQGKTATMVEQGLKDVIANLGFELYEVEYAKKQNGMNLTLFITKKDAPVTINDCELVHRMVDPILDELNPTNNASYYLNVSSVGLDRPLKTDKDFARCTGKSVIVKLFSGAEKEIIGTIKSFDSTTLTLETELGEKVILRQNISLCKQNIDF